jgi:hypothetical protein
MTPRRQLQALLACACLLAGAGGCDSGASPSDIDVDGAWSGTWQFVTGGVTVTDTVTASLEQDGNDVTGTWTAASGPAGELTFAVAESISGTLTITQTTITGQTCTATSPITGTASATAIDFSASAPTAAGICQFAASNQFSLRR